MATWRNNDDWRDRLAQWFAPTLIIAKEFTTPTKSSVHGAPEQDYHPRDIRLVLRAVGDRPKQDGGIVIAAIPRTWPLRKVLGAVWKPFGVLETLARSWPRQLLVLSAFVASGWLGILSYALREQPGLLFDWQWYVVAVTYGLLMALMLVAADLAIWHVPPTRWHIAPPPWLLVFAITAATLPLAFALCWQFESPGPRASAVALAAVAAAYFLLPLLSLRHRTDPLKLLDRLEAIARADAGRTISVSLRYLQAGPPNDAVAHRRRYWQLIQRSPDEPSSYPPTAYAHVVRGTGFDAQLIAIQYWFAYYYDDWANKHEMDWEQVTVYLRCIVDTPEPAHDQVVPLACGFSQHFSGAVVPWDRKLEKRVRHDAAGAVCGVGPVAYVACGSHANYPGAGRFRPAVAFGGFRFTGKDLGFLGRSPERYIDRCLPASRDGEPSVSDELAVPSHRGVPATIDGKPNHCALRVVTLPEEPQDGELWTHDPSTHTCDKDARGVCVGDFRWLNLRGLWGSPGRILGGDDAPKSPTQKPEWIDPFFWLEECEPYARPFGRVLLERAKDEVVQLPAAALAGDGHRP